MNIFFIPSWYPNQTNPLSGVFIKEQIEAIAEIEENLLVLVSLWGHDDSLLPIKKLWHWPKKLHSIYKRKHCKKIISHKNFYEIYNVKGHWSTRKPFRGLNRLIQINRENFKLANQRFQRVDLIHAHVSFPAGFIASILCEEYDVPYILTEHMSPFPFSELIDNGKLVPEVKEAFEKAKFCIAVSPTLASNISSFGLPKPIVIPNMVDERMFYCGSPNNHKMIFLTLGGISKQKGINHLLEAIALWDPSPYDFEFRIGGEGPMLESYKKQSKDLGIDDRVVWLGPVNRSKVPNLFRDSHVYVMPSLHETFGVVYAEAIASGKPIIATRCGGPESIVNEDNGKLVEIGNIQELSLAMKEVANKWKEYQPWLIRNDFEQRFSRKVVVRQLMSLYQQALT